MKYQITALRMILLMLPALALAGQAQYDDCILKYMKEAKLDVAVTIIKRACDENYRNSSFIPDKRKAYNACLLEHLVGVESLQAVMDIKAACNSKYQ
jgi:hypothetical protein